MNNNTTKQSLLYNLASAKYWENTNKEAANIFHNAALEIYNSKIPSIRLAVRELIDEQMITKEGKLTFKGELATMNNVHNYGQVHLGIQTNLHLRECIKRNCLSTKGNVKGVLSFLTNKELEQTLTAICDEAFNRVITKETKASDLINSDTALYIVELSAFVEQELGIPQVDNEVIDIENQVIVEVEQVEEKPKKKRKTSKVVEV